jgi:DNA end-binding protein Ku
LVEPESIEVEEAKKSPGDREVQMASKLVESLAGDFKPEKYEDTYRNAVLELIDRKARGEEIDTTRAEPREETDDLMAALEASLSGAGKD